jgi:ABC-2 type transport system ATP-binding protein
VRNRTRPTGGGRKYGKMAELWPIDSPGSILAAHWPKARWPAAVGHAIYQAMTALAINVEQLTKRFVPEGAPAVDAIGFQVPAGRICGLLGGNGAGKTTTISMLLGILVPTSGRVELLGHDMLQHRFRALPAINFSSPYVDLPGRLTVRENLTVFGRLYGVRDLAKRIAELAEELDFAALLDR